MPALFAAKKQESVKRDGRTLFERDSVVQRGSVVQSLEVVRTKYVMQRGDVSVVERTEGPHIGSCGGFDQTATRSAKEPDHRPQRVARLVEPYSGTICRHCKPLALMHDITKMTLDKYMARGGDYEVVRIMSLRIARVYEIVNYTPVIRPCHAAIGTYPKQKSLKMNMNEMNQP